MPHIEQTVNNARDLPPVEWHQPPAGCVADLKGDGGQVTLKFGTISQGRGSGIEVVQIDTGPMQVTVLPTRGMSVWQIVCDGVPFKWNSPVSGPVHPSLVPLYDPNGLGWLEGFDELLVRCGCISNGAPDFDEAGQLLYPLHGRAGNIPADTVWCEESDGACVLAGDIFEKRLFFNNLQLATRLKVSPGGRQVEIEDTISNLSAQDATSQMLYHINIGAPVLGDGARLMVPFEELAPRNEHAASDIPTWDRYPGPVAGYQEQVHFCRMNCDSEGRTAMMLQAAGGEQGVGVSYDTHTLPYFIVWKNTAAHQDGYVTGLEPSTNFPNPRTFEGQHDRVSKLAAGESVTHRLAIHPLTSRSQVDKFAATVQPLMAKTPMIHESPKSDWSA